MRNKFNIVLVPLFIMTVLFAGCDGIITNPVLNERQPIKSISKWKIDVNNDSKTVRVLYKEFDKTGNVILQEDFSDDGVIIFKSIYSYEENKSTEVKSSFDETGTVKSEELVEYEFDSSRRIIRETRYDKNGNVLLIFEFTYDSFGNVIKKTQTKNNSGPVGNINIEYNYSQSGELIERVTLNEKGNLTRDSIAYNSTNRSVTIYKFDNHGKLSEKIMYNYNSSGNILTELIYSPDNLIIRKFLYEYEYFPKD